MVDNKVTIFSDKFNPRLSKPRKNNPNIGSRTFTAERLDESDQLKEFKSLNLDLGDRFILHFDETKGEWQYQDDGDGDGDEGEMSKSTISKDTINSNKSELVKLKKAFETLQEENRMLKLKVELLVDLVIEKGEMTD